MFDNAMAGSLAFGGPGNGAAHGLDGQSRGNLQRQRGAQQMGMGRAPQEPWSLPQRQNNMENHGMGPAEQVSVN